MVLYYILVVLKLKNMLNAETKRHIDDARDCLVGKVLNPIYQIEQITNTLIYKFMCVMNDMFDYILANPPFMTPKGGIRPHKKFGVKANRAEVLFVDYMVEYLKTNGRAGIIVPEGIFFQSATAYKSLRKIGVENGLYAVVSLLGGVFQSYSGVKKSILQIDKRLKNVADFFFVEIKIDGYDLGAQRRLIDKNDLPEAIKIIKEYRNNFINNKK